jgi:hypothetical protein
MVYQMQDKLEQIKKEIEMLTLQEAQAEGPVYDIKLEKESLEEVKLDTHKEIDVENMHKQSYMHMRERLKKDFTAAKIQTGELEASLKSKQQILELEMLKFRKTKEAKL